MKLFFNYGKLRQLASYDYVYVVKYVGALVVKERCFIVHVCRYIYKCVACYNIIIFKKLIIYHRENHEYNI